MYFDFLTISTVDPRNYELMSRIEDVIQIYWNEWNGRFSLITKNNKSEMIPVVLGQRSNLGKKFKLTNCL